MPNKRNWMALAAALAMANAHAADESLSSINIGELGRVQSQTILYKAMAERREAQQKAEVNISDSLPPAVEMPGGQTPTPPVETSSQESSLPVVKAITGSSQRLRATLLYSGGAEFDTTIGSKLPGGFSVHQLTLDGVVLSRRGQLYPLGFSNRISSAGSTTGIRTAAQPFNLPGQVPGQ
jgi:type IV pilus biogenesis protein PilP